MPLSEQATTGTNLPESIFDKANRRFLTDTQDESHGKYLHPKTDIPQPEKTRHLPFLIPAGKRIAMLIYSFLYIRN
ncbi:MAG: hypothetical protein EA394_05620 [Bacteroidia bacterium]|nr:MAG: hypothetical protein EA394_05620 [Bacteroidia bacterium]